MAEEFTGLTVKFGANTVEFDNSVKGINSALSQLKKELQTINKQLKLDPNNVELLNRKMQNFQQQAEIGAKKIEALRKEQAALGNEKIGTAEWQKLENEIQQTEAQMQIVQRAIDKTQSKLKSLTPGNIEYVNRQLDTMSKKLDTAAEKVGKVKEGFDKAGNAVAPFSAAAAGALVAGAKAAGDLQEQVSKTKAVFKDNSDEMDKFAQGAIDNINMSENTARGIMNTYGAMGSGLGLTEKANKDMAKTLTSLTADVVAFNDVSEDRAATALKGIYTGETESLKELGVVMTQTNLENYAANKGYEKSIKEMSEAEKVALRYAYVQDAMADAQGAAKREQDSFNGQLRLFKEQIIEIATNIGKILIPALEPLLKHLNNMTEQLRKMEPEQLEKVVKVLIGIAGLAPMLLGTSKVLGVVQGALSGMSKAMLFLKDTKFAGAIAKIFGGISIGPILAIIAAVVAIGVALKQVWDENEAFRNYITNSWKWISDSIGVIVTNLVAIFQSLIKGADLRSLLPIWDLFKEAVATGAVIIQSAINLVVDVFEGLTTIVRGVMQGNNKLVQQGINTIVTAFQDFYYYISSWVAGVDWGGLAKTALNAVINGIKKIAPLVIAAFKLIFNTAVNWIKSVDWVAVGSWVIRTITNGIKALGSFLWSSVQSIFKTAMNFIKSIDWHGVGSTMMNYIIRGISALGGMIWNTLRGIFTNAKSNSTSSIDWGGIGNKIISMIGQAISTVGGAIWSMLRGALSSALENARNVDWSGVGRAIVNGITSGLSGLGDALWGKISGAFESAKSWVADKWNALKGSGDFAFSGTIKNKKGQSVNLAGPAMPALAMAGAASSGTNLAITVNTKGSGAKEIAREVERIIVRRIQS